ncbi:hypothetical protein [Arthrobacter sp. N1]|uniref:hypothetical protein n=1 Tax=Arthrobacter sp. N1 TaxID=619291 RepID=UPI003BB1B7E7
MANDYDSQLIESVTVRRNRLTNAVLFGANPHQRRWMDSVRLFLFSVALAAVVASVCVGISFVSNLLEEQRERQQQQQNSAVGIVHQPAGDPRNQASPWFPHRPLGD